MMANPGLERVAPVALNGIKSAVVIVFISVLPGGNSSPETTPLLCRYFASLWHPAATSSLHRYDTIMVWL
jgi:hypothetical protein